MTIFICTFVNVNLIDNQLNFYWSFFIVDIVDLVVYKTFQYCMHTLFCIWYVFNKLSSLIKIVLSLLLLLVVVVVVVFLLVVGR